MPKVTFILRDGSQKTVEFESGKLPYQHHGLPESFLDVAINAGIHSNTPAAAAARARRVTSSSKRGCRT